jgi:superfamily I DNA/RNA helicase
MPEFKFALPPITELIADQRLAYAPCKSLLVSGGPGSGKTVVTIYRFLRPMTEEKDIILFTFNRTLIYSIRGTLKDRSEELFGEFDPEKIEAIIENNLATFYQWHKDSVAYFDPNADEATIEKNFKYFIKHKRGNVKFDEMFFDEGQDIPPSVYANIFALTDQVSIGADRSQNYKGHYPTDEVEDIIEEKLTTQEKTKHQYLGTNFRNTRQIFEFAKKFVPKDTRVQAINSTNLRNGNEPEIYTALNQVQQLEYMKRVIEANLSSNIGILVHFGNEIPTIKQYLERHGYSCKNDAPEAKSFSYYCYDMDRDDELVLKKKLRTPFITTFESCKGLEFDIVIMPFFESSDNAMTKVNSEGRNWATKNHYYVAVTRAKNDLIILCNNKPNSLGFYKKT